MDKIVKRIEREAGVPGLSSILAERLRPTDLQSLLLKVYRLRALSLKPPDVLADFESNRFVRPSAVPPSSLLEWERTALAHLPDEFEPLALSPVCPLGTNSVIASIDQNWSVSTARNTEVVSDSTNVLALESALRRRALLRTDPRSSVPVHLAASHRLLRGQFYDDPDCVPHFSTFVLCSAGRDQGNLGFELSALRMHVGFYLIALRAFAGDNVALSVSVTNLGVASSDDRIESGLVSWLRLAFSGTDCNWDNARTGGRGYYDGVCFKIHAALASGRPIELVDGGCVDWTQRLLSNAKERLVISGIGSERLCAEFGKRRR